MNSTSTIAPPRMGDIGEDQREYEFEPLTAPSVPEPAPVEVPEREAVPA